MVLLFLWQEFGVGSNYAPLYSQIGVLIVDPPLLSSASLSLLVELLCGTVKGLGARMLTPAPPAPGVRC